MTKRIILTTMSTLPKNPNKNFYKTENQKYCEGISQLEAGTKYYLSTVENIKEIVAIGSNEVIDSAKDLLTKVCLKDQFKERNVVQEIVDHKEPSAYSMFSYGIHCFLNNEEEPSPIQLSVNRIDEIRQKQLDQIIETNQADSLDDRMKKINNAIKEDIQKAYLSKDEKEAYRLGKIPEFKVEEGIEPYIETVKKERSLSLFGKEIIFVRLFDEIQNKVLDMTSKKEEVVSMDVVKKYQEDLQKLTIELEDIRSNRLSTETQYAKEKIFENLDSSSKLTCLEENKNVDIKFVPLKKANEIDNIQGLLNSIQKNHEEIEIYLDMQGGSRTDGYIRSAVLSLLNNDETSKVKLKKVIAVDFERGKFFNPIKNETKRYKITDLVSGMNAFINYGKAEQLNQTWKELTEDDSEDAVQDIIDLMRRVDQSLSLCDVDALAESIRQLYKNLSNEIEVTNSNEEFMEVLRTNILEDYKGIVKNGEIDIFALVEWAEKKGFIQQAITLIESRMPEQMIKDGYLSYCPTLESREKVIKIIASLRNNKIVQDYKLDNIDHLMVQQAAHGFKGKKNNAKVKNYIHVYENNIDVLKKYAIVWNRRNEANHAGNNSMPYKDTIQLVDDFIQSYKDFRVLLKEKGYPLSCIRIFKKDVKPYLNSDSGNKNRNKKKTGTQNKAQKSNQEQVKKSEPKELENNQVEKSNSKEVVSNNKQKDIQNDNTEMYEYDYCLFIHDHTTPYTGAVTKTKKGEKKNVYPQIKALYNKYMEGVNNLLNLEEKSKTSEHVYLDSEDKYLDEIKQKSKEAKEKNCHAVFVVAKDIYDANSEIFTKEIESRQHDLYIIDTKTKPMKIVE